MISVSDKQTPVINQTNKPSPVVAKIALSSELTGATLAVATIALLILSNPAGWVLGGLAGSAATLMLIGGLLFICLGDSNTRIITDETKTKKFPNSESPTPPSVEEIMTPEALAISLPLPPSPPPENDADETKSNELPNSQTPTPPALEEIMTPSPSPENNAALTYDEMLDQLIIQMNEAPAYEQPAPKAKPEVRPEVKQAVTPLRDAPILSDANSISLRPYNPTPLPPSQITRVPKRRPVRVKKGKPPRIVIKQLPDDEFTPKAVTIRQVLVKPRLDLKERIRNFAAENPVLSKAILIGAGAFLAHSMTPRFPPAFASATNHTTPHSELISLPNTALIPMTLTTIETILRAKSSFLPRAISNYFPLFGDYFIDYEDIPFEKAMEQRIVPST